MDRLYRPPTIRTTRTRSGDDRWLVDLHERDLRRYERAVRPAVTAIERHLGPRVVANRVSPAGLTAPFATWELAMRSVASRPGWRVVRSDVRACYRTIGPEAIDEGLRRSGVTVSARSEITRFLRSSAAVGIDGLPIGPWPSAVLANAVLAIADDAVHAEGAVCWRWVDDVVIAGEPDRVKRAALAWRASIDDLGLSAHDGKHAEGPAAAVSLGRTSFGGRGSRAMMPPT